MWGSVVFALLSLQFCFGVQLEFYDDYSEQLALQASQDYDAWKMYITHPYQYVETTDYLNYGAQFFKNYPAWTPQFLSTFGILVDEITAPKMSHLDTYGLHHWRQQLYKEGIRLIEERVRQANGEGAVLPDNPQPQWDFLIFNKTVACDNNEQLHYAMQQLDKEYRNYFAKNSTNETALAVLASKQAQLQENFDAQIAYNFAKWRYYITPHEQRALEEMEGPEPSASDYNDDDVVEETRDVPEIYNLW